MKRVKPEDKLFFKHLRYETFYSNLERFANVTMVQADVRAGLKLLAASGVSPEVVFIDCEKKVMQALKCLRFVYSVCVQLH